METNQSEIVCNNCAAKLAFEPGTTSLKCPYCGAENAIEISTATIEEIDLESFLRNKSDLDVSEQVVTVQCNACGSETTFDDNVVSDNCAFCGTPLVLDNKKSGNRIKPKSLLPFGIKKNTAADKYKVWINKLWFAPNDLKKYARMGKINGMYIPYWTFDANTLSNYTGERGDHYQETERYTDSEGNQKTRTVTRTRWTSVRGRVDYNFDDVLAVATKSLPEKYIDSLEPWDTKKLVPYDSKFITGFKTESYQVELKEGFVIAKDKMEDKIRIKVKRNIGGDQQRIHSLSTLHNDVTFKHILLPLWISTYRYSDTIYRFLVNAQTGEVQGERPYSWIKIAFAIIVALALIATIFVLANYNQ